MRTHPATTAALLSLCVICTAALAQKTMALEDVRRLVDAKKSPAVGTPTSKAESLVFSACVARIESAIKAGGTKQVSRTIVSTNLMRVEKIWTTGAATTLTCLASDQKFVTTTAPYL
jgi:hypothetical protein